MAKSIKVWNGSSWEDVAVAMPDTSTFVTTSTVTELAQDAIGNNLSDLFTYNDSTGGITLNNAKISDFLLDGASGNSYGLVGTSTYLDVKNTNGYNKEIELDITAVKTQLNTDGYLTAPSQSGNSGKYLTTNGTTTSWGSVSASGGGEDPTPTVFLLMGA
jgi:hypothetical protein